VKSISCPVVVEPFGGDSSSGAAVEQFCAAATVNRVSGARVDGHSSSSVSMVNTYCPGGRMRVSEVSAVVPRMNGLPSTRAMGMPGQPSKMPLTNQR
jgi:hypothetical protein